MTHKVEEQNVKKRIMIFNFILSLFAKKNSRAEVRVAHQCPIHYFRKR